MAFTSAAVAQSLTAPDQLGDDGPAAADTADLPALRQGWQFSLFGQADLTFTDNAYLTPRNKTSDFILSPTALLMASETSAKSIFDATLEVAHDFYARASDLNGLRVNALTDGTFTLIDDTLSVRARAATNLQSSSQQGIAAATNRTIGGNQVQIVNYGISPVLRQQVADGIFAEAVYDFSGVAFVRAPTGSTRVAADDSIRQEATIKLSNAQRSRIVRWDLTGGYEQRDLSDGGRTSRRANGEAYIEYRITPTFALLTTGGYEWFDEPTLTERLNGLYGLGGILLRPTSRTSLRLEGGYRYRKPTFVGELTYSHSQRLIIAASFNQGIDTSQGFIDDAFNRLQRNDTAIIIDPITNLPPDPSTSPFDLSNQAFRSSKATLRVNGDFGRTFYNISGRYERRSVSGAKGESWGGDIMVGRDLTRRLSIALEAQHTNTKSPTITINPNLNSETTAATARLSYRLGPTVNTSLSYSYLKRATSLINYNENAVVLSIRKRF